MARGANAVCVAMVNRELCVLRVIEGRTRPGGRGVASRAGSREELRLRGVAGIRGVVVIGLMATDAGRRQRGVVAVDVAIGALAWRDRMRSGQGERRVVVVEGGIGPSRRVMA